MNMTAKQKELCADILEKELIEWKQFVADGNGDHETLDFINAIEAGLATMRFGKRYAVTCVDYGDSVDGKARFIGLYDTEAEAKEAVRKDMDEYVNICHCTVVSYADWYAYTNDDHEHGCEWNIEEKEV